MRNYAELQRLILGYLFGWGLTSIPNVSTTISTYFIISAQLTAEALYSVASTAWLGSFTSEPMSDSCAGARLSGHWLRY